MPSAHDVAKFFLSLSDEDQSGDLISNLKLQKLLYYAQGFHLAIHNTPLFPQAIKAWMHGPVVPDVWHAYRHFGPGPIPIPTGFDPNAPFSEEQLSLLRDVYATYGQFSAWKLRELTHQESPWRDTARDTEITHRRLKDYFDTQVDDDEEAIEA